MAENGSVNQLLIDIPLVLRRIKEMVLDAKLEAASNATYIAIDVPAQFSVAWLQSVVNATDLAYMTYLFDPDCATHFLAVGEAATIVVDGADRLAVVKAEVQRLSDAVSVYVASGSQNSPPSRLFGGCAFSEDSLDGVWAAWPASYFFLPMFTFCVQSDGTASLRIVVRRELEHDDDEDIREISCLLERLAAVHALHNEALCASTPMPRAKMQDASHVAQPLEDDAQSEWSARVNHASSAIRAGEFDKVVLARMEKVTVRARISTALARLCNIYPDNFTFAFRRGDACFIGSTPERLVRVQDGKVTIDCLAGTMARGDNPQADAAIAAELMHSGKNRREHQAVVDWVQRTIETSVRAPQIPTAPSIKRLANVQHLHTPVTGQLDPHLTVLDIAGLLHPTPAVAGVPREAAMHYLQTVELLQRGWYAGPIGWVDTVGNGAFAVALRSALCIGDTAYLYAGNGIMGDSDAAAEWQENRLKLAPMLNALCTVEGGMNRGE